MLGYSVQAALLALAAASAIAQTAPYNTVTNTKRTVTNFNVETVRGIAFEAVAPFRVFAINTHGSTLNSYTSASTSAPATTFRTLNAPVALALWDDTEGVPFALVVGCGTHGIVKQNRNTGEIAGYLSLPSEPMDIVVDTDRNVAFVSCGGAFDRPATGLATPNGFEAGGVVVEIALGTLTEIRKNFIPSARPAFLNFEPGDPGEIDNRIYVTPMLSGNQTTYLTDNVAADMRVVRTVSGMDDDDLFSIDTLGTVQSVVKKAGTILTAHGRNPFTNQYWILGVESFNAEQHTEPDHKGRFAENRLVITPLPGTPATKSLDTVTAALAPMLLPLSSADKANKPVSFPFGLTFHAQTGFAVVTSSTGDMFRILDANGNAFRNVELPAGSIPRSVMLSPDQQSLYVYAWGTNKLHQYSVANLVNSSATDATPLRTLDLGVDPLPAAIRQGRAIWYDADRSLDKFVSPEVPGKVSCNTCHPRGGMDLLAWELTDTPVDRKDAMVTQSLIGIEDTFPYHWRGERSLADFNGAFAALLGGTQLSAPELSDFEAFVFSLQGAANPRQHVDRVLDDTHKVTFTFFDNIAQSLVTVQGSPITGQIDFSTDTNALATFQPARCIDCHSAESGSNGLITPDISSILPTQGTIDVAHMRQMAHKFFQPLKLVTLADGSTHIRPRGGFGFSQDGDNNLITDFFSPVFFPPTIPGSAGLLQQAQQRANVAAFSAQFDEGIAPRAHFGMMFDVNNPTQATVTNLMAHATDGHIDLVMIGHLFPPAGIEVGLWFDTGSQVFRTAEPNHPNGVTLSLAALENLRQTNSLKMLVLGVPPGNGFRFAVDHDDDGLSATAEIVGGTLTRNPDTDGDGFPDGYEAALNAISTTVSPVVFNTSSDIQAVDTTPPSLVATLDHITGRLSKHFVTFSEPVTYTVQAERLVGGSFVPFGPISQHSARRTVDTMIAHHLRPSVIGATSNQNERYRLRVVATDLAARSSTTIVVGPGGGDLITRPTALADTDPTTPATKIPVILSRPMTVARSGANITVTVPLETLWNNNIGLPTPIAGMTVVLQVLTRSSPSGPWSINSSAVATGAGTRVVDAVEFQQSQLPQTSWLRWGSNGTLAPTPPAVLGKFVISPPAVSTPPTGRTAATFQLPGVTAGTEVQVVLLGVFNEVSPIGGAQPGFTTIEVVPGGTQNWHMSMSPFEGRGVKFIM